MNYRISFRFFIIINLFFALGSSYAQEQVPNDSTQQQPIRVGISHNYPIVYESNGLVTGFHLELLKEVAKEEGWLLDFKFLGSPKNVVQGLESGNLDIGLGLVPTPERQQFLKFTKEKNAILKGQIIVKSSEDDINSMRDLKGKTIGVVNQDIIGKNSAGIFEKLGIRSSFKLVRSTDELVKAVMTDAVDAGICNNFQCEKFTRQYDVHPTTIVFEATEVHFATPQGSNTYIIEALDQYLHKWKMTKGSFYYELEERFLRNASIYEPTYTNRQLLMALGVCLLFILLGVMLGNFMVTESEAAHGSIATTHIKQIIIFVMVMTISFWLMDSFIQWLLFNDENNLTLLELLITQVPLENLYIRGMFFLVCCFCGLFLARYISKYEKMLHIVLTSVNRFEQLTDNARDMIYRMTLPNGEYEFVSKASSAIYGYSPDEFYQTPLLVEKLVHPEWKNYFRIQWEKILAGEITPYYEYQIITKSGEVRWVNQRNTLYFDESGVPSAIDGIVTDVTEQKKAAETQIN